MRFIRFGIGMERLQERRIELVRQWRNSPGVRPYMRFQSVISPEQQACWFAGLDGRTNWYFVAEAEGVPFALFHLKNINWERGSGESGGFVGEPSFIGRLEPARATLALMDFAFLGLRLRSLEAQYKASLGKVMRFNRQLGYEIFRKDSDAFVRASISAERYFRCAEIFRKAAGAPANEGLSFGTEDEFGISAHPLPASALACASNGEPQAARPSESG